MRTKYRFVELILSLHGVLVLIGCAGSGVAVPVVIQPAAQAPTVVSATRAPTALPMVPSDAAATATAVALGTVPAPKAPTALAMVPPDAAATATAFAIATTESSSDSIVEYVTAHDGGTEPFHQPAIVTTDTGGNLYVLESSDQIRKYDKAGNLVAKWGSHGSGDGQFNFGWGGDMAIDPNGNVFVTDLQNHRIQKFDSNGKFLSKWGKEGTGDGQFVGVMGIAVDSNGNVYVTDTNRDPSWNILVPGYKENVQVFDGSGKFLAKWGTAGDGLGLLSLPTDIEIDSADIVYVTSQYSHWINKFDTAGKSLGGWNDCGGEPSSVMDPTGLALDRQGNVYVANLASRRICKFTSDGKFLGAWGRHNYGKEDFLTMFDLTVGDDGTIYVADVEKNQIMVFKQKVASDPTPVATASPAEDLKTVREEPIESVATATLPLERSIGWLEIGFGSVWGVSELDLQRFDPATKQIVAKLPIDKTGVMTIGYDSVWVHSGKTNELFRIDPQTNQVIAKIPVGLANTEGSMAAGEGGVWIPSAAKGILTRIDPATNKVVAEISVAPNSYGATAGYGAVWVTNYMDDSVQRVDPKTNKVVATIPVQSRPRFLSAGEGAIWVLHEDNALVSRIDPKTNEVIETISVGVSGNVGTGGGGDISAGEGAVWVTGHGIPLTIVDPDTNKIVNLYHFPLGGVAVRARDGSVWVTGLHDLKLWRLDPLR